MMRYFLLSICFCFLSFTITAQKMVMFEKFTNAFCGVCPDATVILQEIVSENPNVVWVSHHKPISWGNNPMTNEKSTAIWNDLNILGVPNGMIDRTKYNGSITSSRSFWKDRIAQHLLLPEEFEIEITNVDYDPNARELNFEVTTTPLTDAVEGPFRINTYIVEDSVYGMGQHSYWNNTPGHPLEGLGDVIDVYPHRNVVRTILDDQWGTSDVIPTNPTMGTSYTQSYQYVIPEEYDPNQIKLVANISLFDEVNVYPGVVQNATQLELTDLDIKLTNTKEINFNDFSFGPNPARDFLNINLKTLPSSIKIVDRLGQTHNEIVPEFLTPRIDLEELSTGTYFLVLDFDGVLETQKFSVFK